CLLPTVVKRIEQCAPGAGGIADRVRSAVDGDGVVERVRALGASGRREGSATRELLDALGLVRRERRRVDLLPPCDPGESAAAHDLDPHHVTPTLFHASAMAASASAPKSSRAASA